MYWWLLPPSLSFWSVLFIDWLKLFRHRTVSIAIIGREVLIIGLLNFYHYKKENVRSTGYFPKGSICIDEGFLRALLLARLMTLQYMSPMEKKITWYSSKTSVEQSKVYPVFTRERKTMPHPFLGPITIYTPNGTLTNKYASFAPAL